MPRHPNPKRDRAIYEAIKRGDKPSDVAKNNSLTVSSIYRAAERHEKLFRLGSPGTGSERDNYLTDYSEVAFNVISSLPCQYSNNMPYRLPYKEFIPPPYMLVPDEEREMTWDEGPQNVYLIRDPVSRHTKIGIAKDVIARLRALQTGFPSKLTLEYCGPVSNSLLVERELHRHFRDKRSSGEWFNLTDSELDEARTYIEKCKPIDL